MCFMSLYEGDSHGFHKLCGDSLKKILILSIRLNYEFI